MINATFLPAISTLLHNQQSEQAPVETGDSIRKIAETKNDYQLGLFARDNLQQNLEQRYRELMVRKTETIDAGAASKELVNEYKQEVQIFCDTVLATKMQLEACGYQLNDNDPICILYQHCITSIESNEDDKYSSFLTTPPQFDTLFTIFNTERTETSLQRGISELSGLDEATFYDDKESIFHDFRFIRQLLVDANNLVRSYELETQKPLSMDNPLKRLASFSKAMDSEQLSNWISGDSQYDHPIYAAIHGKYYYVHSDGNGAVYQYTPNEENALEDDEAISQSPDHREPLDGHRHHEDTVIPPQGYVSRVRPSHEHHIRDLPRTASDLTIDELQDDEDTDDFLIRPQYREDSRTCRRSAIPPMGSLSDTASGMFSYGYPYPRKFGLQRPHHGGPTIRVLDDDEEPEVDFHRDRQPTDRSVHLSARSCSMEATDMDSFSSQTHLKHRMPTHSSGSPDVVA
ncbi:hypothetical protein [Kistimonas asteriae]|uniref:hypothetical protein n=1 Tax=Kistimonas asteriae TaxID=517724 RepID=UPI001BAAF5E5|nr:hypothetical protein [Kistimonas asteriae]